MSQSHDYSLVMPAYTSGQPSSVSDAVTVADMSSAVIGLLVTFALVIVISVTIVNISLVVIIVLCPHQGAYGNNDHDPLYVRHLSMSLCHVPLHAASYRVKAPPPRMAIIKWKTSKKSNWSQIQLKRLLANQDDKMTGTSYVCTCPHLNC